MSNEEQIRDDIEKTDNDEPVEPVQETIIEQEFQPVKTNIKVKATPNIKITKDPVEPITEEPEPIKEKYEPVVEEQFLKQQT